MKKAIKLGDLPSIHSIYVHGNAFIYDSPYWNYRLFNNYKDDSLYMSLVTPYI